MASSSFKATDGAGYERVMGRWSARLAPAFLDFAGRLDGHVLDLGCGTGSLAAALCERPGVARVTGIDIAPPYVAYARERVQNPRASFAVEDACALDAAARTFDHGLSLLMLHFVPDAGRAIAELGRVVRPGGTVAAAVWDARGGFVANRMFFDTAAALDPQADLRRQRNYTRPMTRPGELRRAWEQAGFREVRDTVLLIRMEFASFDDYWSPYQSQEGPQAEYLASLGRDERTQLEDAVRRAYLDGEPDGPRSYAAIAWAVAGTVLG